MYYQKSIIIKQYKFSYIYHNKEVNMRIYKDPPVRGGDDIDHSTKGGVK